MLTPARRRGVEILDDPSTPAEVRERAMADVARANRLFGGTRSARLAFRDTVGGLSAGAMLLDVGTGTGDIGIALAREAARARAPAFLLAVDNSEPLVRGARQRGAIGLVGSALDLPLADASVDVVICSQLLHHFTEDDARRLIAELHRVTRAWVIVSDLRRSWVAAGGFWLASTALRFHPVTRADGVVSVFRGFTRNELAALVRDVTGITPRIRAGAFWRISATWRKH